MTAVPTLEKDINLDTDVNCLYLGEDGEFTTE